MKYITGESLCDFLTASGFACHFRHLTVAPQLVRYSLDLDFFGDLPKIRRYMDSLTAWAGTKATFCTSTDSHFAIELQRDERRLVHLDEFADDLASATPYSVALGVESHGNKVVASLDDLTHLLVAGTTGSGKSVALNSIITSLCCYNDASNLGLVLIDPKRTEFTQFARLPHLLTPIVTEFDTAIQALSALVEKMELRYKKMASLGLKKADNHFKKIVVVIDELADLVLQDERARDLLIRLLQKSRACGFHFIVATQSPRASILSGLLLANLPSRLVLTCASARESVLALGCGGAEKLSGKGDAYIKLQSEVEHKRLQVPYINDNELQDIIN